MARPATGRRTGEYRDSSSAAGRIVVLSRDEIFRYSPVTRPGAGRAIVRALRLTFTHRTRTKEDSLGSEETGIVCDRRGYSCTPSVFDPGRLVPGTGAESPAAGWTPQDDGITYVLVNLAVGARAHPGLHIPGVRPVVCGTVLTAEAQAVRHGPVVTATCTPALDGVRRGVPSRRSRWDYRAREARAAR